MAAAVEAALHPLVLRRQGWEDTATTRRAHRRRPAFLTVEDVARQAGATPASSSGASPTTSASAPRP